MNNIAKKVLLVVSMMLCVTAGHTSCAYGNVSDQDTQKKECRLRKKTGKLLQKYESYIMKELNLTKEEANRFFPLYRELDNKCFVIWKDLHKRMVDIESKKNPSKEEVRAYVEAMTKAKVQTANLQNQYYQRFLEFIPGEKLVRLTTLKRKFAQKYFNKIVR